MSPMRFVESRRWSSVIAAVLVGAVGGSLAGFATSPRQRADAEPRAATTTAVARHGSSHATVTVAPTSSWATPVSSRRVRRTSTTSTATEPPTTVAHAKRTTTTATTTTTTTSTTIPPTSSSSSTSTSEPPSESSTSTTVPEATLVSD
jgi:hypothetical protein